jgi:large subunit ribosomal protein L5
MTRFREKYDSEAIPGLTKRFGYANRMMVPKMAKIVVNIGLAEGKDDIKIIEFFDRLVTIATPRIRDFRGLPTNSFDGRGNYTFGLEEHVVFPEINYDDVEMMKGMDVTIVTSARTDEEAFELLKLMGLPFRH